MVDFNGKPRLGRYILMKELSPGVLGDRWLAVHELDTTSHIVHWIRSPHGEDRPRQRRVIQALERASELEHPHILRIEAFALDTRGLPWAVTPFTGDRDGVQSLDRLLRLKGGYLGLSESKQAIEQMLSAAAYAHEWEHRHGELSMAEVHVDRRGSLAVELYGLSHLLASEQRPSEDAERDEVRAIVRIAYQLLTGLRVDDPLIPASRVLENLDPMWDGFFEMGLGEIGFKSSAHALSAIRECRVSGDVVRWNAGRVRSTIGKLLFTEE